MKRCMLCHWLLNRRRWLLLPIAAALNLAMIGLLPSWLWLLIASAVLLVTAMLLIYLRDLRRVWTPGHLRMPSPADGQAEIVMVDAALIDQGPAVLSVAQPLEPLPEMSLRMGGSALLLGTAMILLAEELPRPDAVALTRAAERLNLQPGVIRRRCTVLHRGKESGMTSLTVQDGAEERTWFTGDVETVMKACSAIWEEQPRLMGAGDHARIRDAAKQMDAQGEHLFAFATASGDESPVFLGLAAIGDDVDQRAVQDLSALRNLGVTLILRDDGTRHMDVPVLRRNLDIPDLHARPDIHFCITNPYPDRHCLGIIRHEDKDLVKPVTALREHFGAMALMLKRLSGVMGLCLLCCVLAGGKLSAPAAAAILTAGYLSFGSLVTARAIRPAAAVVTGIVCLLVRLLLHAAVPAYAEAAGTCLCLALTACLSLTLAVPGRKLTFRALAPMLGVVVLGLGLQGAISFSLMPQLLLPAAFCTVCGLLGGFLLLLTGR